jgi:hypothetical protein
MPQRKQGGTSPDPSTAPPDLSQFPPIRPGTAKRFRKFAEETRRRFGVAQVTSTELLRETREERSR